MKKIQLLDCTLRDGGRVMGCKFGQQNAVQLSHDLADAGVDIIELGFIRDKITYDSQTTFFTSVEQMRPLIGCRSSTYVAFVDYGMFDINAITPHDGTSIDGIRLGFRKQDLAKALPEMRRIKELGYLLFVQGIDSLGYSDREMLELIETINEIEPYSFGMVDTFGAMYPEDLQHIFRLIDYNLAPGIRLDFHSHNNYQLSFALAQELLRQNTRDRPLIIDVTLNGMGKGAGNLCAELIADYLNKKQGSVYHYERLLDAIDQHILPLKNQYDWGYSIPAAMAGELRSHPNNVIYLCEKFSLATKDIHNILGMIEPEQRKSYNYDNLERLYAEYVATKMDDTAALATLKAAIGERPVLVLLPGASVNQCREKLMQVAKEKNCFVLPVNFICNFLESNCLFFGNQRRYDTNHVRLPGKRVAVTGNVSPIDPETILIDYFSVIKKGNQYFDNSGIMVLRLLERLSVPEIYLAGFDGFSTEVADNYVNESFENARYLGSFWQANQLLSALLRTFPKSFLRRIQLLTPSVFTPIFEGENE